MDTMIDENSKDYADNTIKKTKVLAEVLLNYVYQKDYRAINSLIFSSLAVLETIRDEQNLQLMRINYEYCKEQKEL